MSGEGYSDNMGSEEQPSVLYKYCGADRLDVLRNRLIRFTQRDELNDIYEMKPQVVVDQESRERGRAQLAKNYPQVLNIPTRTAEEEKQLVENVMDTALVLSLSASWDIIPMWSYYAKAHQGFVIGFDAQHPFLAGCNRVHYTQDYPTLSNSFEPALFWKFEQWSHEHEWRAFRNLERESPDQTLCARVYLYSFDPAAIVEVVVGHRASKDLRCLILGVLRDEVYRNVQAYQAVPDNNRWTLLRKPIPFR